MLAAPVVAPALVAASWGPECAVLSEIEDLPLAVAGPVLEVETVAVVGSMVKVQGVGLWSREVLVSALVVLGHNEADL